MNLFLLLSTFIAVVYAISTGESKPETISKRTANFNAKEMIFGQMTDEEKNSLGFKEEQKVWCAKVVEKMMSQPETQTGDLNDLIYKDLTEEAQKVIGLTKDQELWFGSALVKLSKTDQAKGLFRVPDINPDKTGPPSNVSHEDHEGHENHASLPDSKFDVSSTLKATSSKTTNISASTKTKATQTSTSKEIMKTNSSGTSESEVTKKAEKPGSEKSSGSQNEWALFGGAVAAVFVVLL